ncbi:hypothetical protein FHX16_004175 [Rhizobium sp. BK661]|nr:hypothetical protein [Rhizobium sp. BK661]
MNVEGRWSLSPAYDRTFSSGPGGEHSTAQEKAKSGQDHLLTISRERQFPIKLQMIS